MRDRSRSITDDRTTGEFAHVPRNYWQQDLFRAIHNGEIHPKTNIPYYRAVYSLIATTKAAGVETFLRTAEIIHAHRVYDPGIRGYQLHVPDDDFARYLYERWMPVMDLKPIDGGMFDKSERPQGYRRIALRDQPLTGRAMTQALDEIHETFRPY